jgi:DNA-binding beta-propeller fold protein YncE
VTRNTQSVSETPRAEASRTGDGARMRRREAAAVFVSAASLLMAGPVSAQDPEFEPRALITSGFGGAPFQAPTGVVFDAKRGELVVANSGLQRIEFLTADGRPKARFLHRVRRPDGEVVDGQPRALAVTHDGRLLVVDFQATYVDVLDFRGRSVGRLELPERDATLADGPGAVAVEPGGTFLVSTRGEAGRIYRFGSDYRRLGEWGVSGGAPGELSRICCLAALPDGRVVVGCAGTELAVQIFDAQGAYLKGFGRHDVGAGNFSLASGVTTTADGRIWVVDELRQTLQVFDSEGSYIGRVGTGGEGPGEFLYPNSIAALGDTLFAVTERVGNRVQLLRIR